MTSPGFEGFKSCDLDLWSLELKIGSPLTRAVGNVSANFDFSTFLCFRVTGRRTDRRTGKMRNAMLPIWRRIITFKEHLRLILTHYKVRTATWRNVSQRAALHSKTERKGIVTLKTLQSFADVRFTAKRHRTRRATWLGICGWPHVSGRIWQHLWLAPRCVDVEPTSTLLQYVKVTERRKRTYGHCVAG